MSALRYLRIATYGVVAAAFVLSRQDARFVIPVSLAAAHVESDFPDQSWEWCSMSEIERIALAIELTDFPIEQAGLRRHIGIPRVPPTWGSSDRERGTFWFWPLTDSGSWEGHYALRIFYDDSKPEPKVTDIDMMFKTPTGLWFVYEPSTAYERLLPKLKQMMRERNQSPSECVGEFLRIGDETTEAQPGATDNPDDAQRLREDH